MGEAMKVLCEALLVGARSEEIFDRACDFGVDATLYRMADPLGIKLDDRWRTQWRWHLAETMARRRELCDVVEGLEREVGAILVLKGEPLAVRLYGDGYARRSGDLDVMCEPDQIDRAWQVLRSWGCQPLHGARPEPWRYNQWACARPGTGRVIELHWNLCAPEIGAPSFEDLYARSVEVELGSQGRVRALGDGDQLLHAAYHFHHHMGFLKGLLDVAAWWDRCGEDRALLAAVSERAEHHGVRSMLDWPLGALAHLTQGRCGQRSSVGVSSVFSAWTAWSMHGAFDRGVDADTGLLGFKTKGVTQGEVVAWRLLGLMLVRGGLRAGLGVALRSPEQMRRERGGEYVELEDWVKWGERIGQGIGEIVTTSR